MWRLCSQQRLWSVFSKKRGVNRKAGPPVHDDLVLRGFTATKLNQLWLTDITQHWTDEGKLYLCAIKDGRFQGASTTPLISSFSFSRGVLKPRVFLGRSLSWWTMASIASSEMLLKPVPVG